MKPSLNIPHTSNHGDSQTMPEGLQVFETQNTRNPSEIVFNDDDLAKIEEFKRRYPNQEAAVMPTLWLAQEKFGWLSQESIELVADTLNMPHADVFGVASFYTMYFKKPKGKLHVAVCTNISCQLCGGYEIYNFIRQTFGLENGEVTGDGKLSLEEAECLGSCGTAPVAQINNGDYMENLTLEKFKAFLKDKGIL